MIYFVKWILVSIALWTGGEIPANSKVFYTYDRMPYVETYDTVQLIFNNREAATQFYQETKEKEIHFNLTRSWTIRQVQIDSINANFN